MLVAPVMRRRINYKSPQYSLTIKIENEKMKNLKIMHKQFTILQPLFRLI